MKRPNGKTAVTTTAAPIVATAAPPAPIPAPAPKTTVTDTRAAIKQLAKDAGETSELLAILLRTVTGDPVLHGQLHRMQTALGDLRHGLSRSANHAA